MGIIATDEAFDDEYSKEVIAKVRELSPELDEYVVTQQYLGETAQDNLSPLWLRNKLISKVLEQLRDRGITFSMDDDEIVDSPMMVKVVLVMRAKFDQDRLFDLLKSSDSIANFVREVMDDPDCADDISGYCNHMLPLDEGWDLLKMVYDDKPGIYSANETFVETVLKPVLDRLDEIPDTSVVTDENENVVGNYVEFLGKRKAAITQYAKTMYGTRVGLEDNTAALVSNAKIAAVEGQMVGFEKELARNNIIQQLDPNNQTTIQLGEIRQKFIPRWKHTLEYWMLPEHQDDVPSELVVSIMVATMFEDFGANSEARVKVIESFESYADQMGDRYDKFRELFDNALANLVVGAEGGVSC